jgi:hypothetical protein
MQMISHFQAAALKSFLPFPCETPTPQRERGRWVGAAHFYNKKKKGETGSELSKASKWIFMFLSLVLSVQSSSFFSLYSAGYSGLCMEHSTRAERHPNA